MENVDVFRDWLWKATQNMLVVRGTVREEGYGNNRHVLTEVKLYTQTAGHLYRISCELLETQEKIQSSPDLDQEYIKKDPGPDISATVNTVNEIIGWGLRGWLEKVQVIVTSSQDYSSCQSIPPHSHHFLCALYHLDGRLKFCAEKDKVLYVFQARLSPLLARLQKAHDNAFVAIAQLK